MDWNSSSPTLKLYTLHARLMPLLTQMWPGMWCRLSACDDPWSPVQFANSFLRAPASCDSCSTFLLNAYPLHTWPVVSQKQQQVSCVLPGPSAVHRFSHLVLPHRKTIRSTAGPNSWEYPSLQEQMNSRFASFHVSVLSWQPSDTARHDMAKLPASIAGGHISSVTLENSWTQLSGFSS